MKIHGLQQALSRLTFDDSVIRDVLDEVGNNILASTKSGLSDVSTTVANSYNMHVTRDANGWTVNVGSNLDLSAYIEFGSGGYVVSPDPLVSSAYMMEWYVNGRGTTRPHPALFPSFRAELPKLVDALNKELQKIF